MKKLCIVIFLFGIGILGGCAELQWPSMGPTRPATGPSSTGPAMGIGEMDVRDEAISRYSYRGSTDQVFVEQPMISPGVVRRGGKITQEFKYAILSPQRNKEFRVLEVVNLSGKKISVELSRKETQQRQSVATSSLDFVIPRDLPYGDYTLMTTIDVAGVEQKTVVAGFKVAK